MIDGWNEKSFIFVTAIVLVILTASGSIAVTALGLLGIVAAVVCEVKQKIGSTLPLVDGRVLVTCVVLVAIVGRVDSIAGANEISHLP